MSVPKPSKIACDRTNVLADSSSTRSKVLLKVVHTGSIHLTLSQYRAVLVRDNKVDSAPDQPTRAWMKLTCICHTSERLLHWEFGSIGRKD